MSFTKQKKYYSHERSDLLDLLPANMKLEKVLDVGCGSGATGQYLKNYLQAKEVAGIEMNADMAKQAKTILDRVIVGDIQQIELPFDQHYFDCIICADILEHLYDPWSILFKLKNYLKNTGCLLLSVPNIQHWSIIARLLAGKWYYQDEGILDNTHIRFFTRKSLGGLIERCGFQIEKISGAMGKETRLVNCLTLGLFSNFLSFRYFVLARKSNRK